MDGRLAGGRRPLEQEGAARPAGDGRLDRGRRPTCWSGVRAASAGRTGTRRSGREASAWRSSTSVRSSIRWRRARPATALPPCRAGQVGRRQRRRRVRGQLGQEGQLARAEPRGRQGLSGRRGPRRGEPRVREGRGSTDARACRGRLQDPCEVDRAGRRRLAEGGDPAPPAPGPIGASRSTATPAGPASTRAAMHGRRQVRAGRRQAAGRDRRHQAQPLQQAGRQHRPQHDRRRREVVLGQPCREPQAEGRQQRSVGADAREQRLGRHRRLGSRSQDDAQGLPAAELDDDRLARLEAGQGRRHGVRVGPVPRGRRFDRDLHERAARRSPFTPRCDGPR